tara:strand:+ start:419 stop:1111 length:693 start_codon:yes stop_codon:yes gene_type:complete
MVLMASFRIKVSELVRLIRARVEDPTGLAFPDQEIHDALDQAQRYICSVIHNKYLTSFEQEVSLISSGEGIIDLKELSDVNSLHGLFRGDLLSVSVYRQNKIKSFKRIDIKDLDKLDNEYLNSVNEAFYYYIFADKLHLIPQDSFNCVIRYLKQPNLIYNNVTNQVAEHCELASVLIDPMLDFAESYLWKTDNKPNRVTLAQSSGINMINLLNQRHMQDTEMGLADTGDN